MTGRPDQQQPVTVSADAGVTTIALSRPSRANAMDAAFFDAMAGALDDVQEDESARVVVLVGDGRHFCAGGDLDHPLFDEHDPLERRRHIEAAYEVTARMLDLDVPIVCALQGRVAGAATALVLASDLRVAARSTVFSLDFVRLGLSPDMGVAWLLAPAIGTARAVEWAITGDLVGAETAREWGLVSRVVDDGDERRVAFELAERLTEHPRGGLAAIRRLVRTAPTLPRSAGFEAEIASMNALIPSEASQARLTAFRSRSTRRSG